MLRTLPGTRVALISGGPLVEPARVLFKELHGVWFCEKVEQSLSVRLPGSHSNDSPIGATYPWFERLARYWKARIEWL